MSERNIERERELKREREREKEGVRSEVTDQWMFGFLRKLKFLSHDLILNLISVYILRFCQSNLVIGDDHPSLLPFFKTLEDILEQGLLPRSREPH